jgi:hypothetical protein
MVSAASPRRCDGIPGPPGWPRTSFASQVHLPSPAPRTPCRLSLSRPSYPRPPSSPCPTACLALPPSLLTPPPLPTHTAAPPYLPPPPYPMIPAPGHPSTTDGAGEAERPGSLQDAARDTTAAAVKRRGPTLRAAFCLYTTQRCSGGPFTRDPAWVGPLKL